MVMRVKIWLECFGVKVLCILGYYEDLVSCFGEEDDF